MIQAVPSTLTSDEEITLRRVAFGESEVRAMRAQDLERLHKLQLIEDGKDGPRLTADGQQRFDALPKATGQIKSGSGDDPMTEIMKFLDEAQR